MGPPLLIALAFVCLFGAVFALGFAGG